MRHSIFTHQREFLWLSSGMQDRNTIGIHPEACIWGGDVVRTDKGQALPHEFLSCVLEQILGLGREADLDEGIGEVQQKVLVLDQFQDELLAPFFQLVRAGAGDPEVRNRRGHQEDIGGLAGCEDGLPHVRHGFHVPHKVVGFETRWRHRRDQGDVRTTFTGGISKGETHLARGPIPNEPDGIDGFSCASSRYHDVFSLQVRHRRVHLISLAHLDELLNELRTAFCRLTPIRLPNTTGKPCSALQSITGST
jgi:hypothetical protein